LVVEILSPATALKDKHTKFSLYEKFGMKYYMLADEERNKVEIYSIENSTYSLQQTNQDSIFTFMLDDGCNIELLLNNIWE
jgi:Uma2 family endonuclease